MKEKLNKAKIVNLIHKDIPDYHKYEIKDVYESFMRIIREQLTEGNQLNFDGIFKVHMERPKPKNIYSARINEIYISPGYPRLVFTVNENLKKRIWKEYDGKVFKDRTTDE